MPKNAEEIRPSYASGMPRKERLIVVGENAHLVSPVIAEVETETSVFRGRKTRKEVSEPEAEPEPIREELQEAWSAPLEPTERRKFSDDVLAAWREDSQAFRDEPEPFRLAEPAAPAIIQRSGIVSERNDRKKYLFVESEGIKYFAHYKETYRPGNHFCFYAANTPVLFDVEQGSTRATNVRFVAPVTLPTIEAATMVYWNRERHYGFCRRPCGCECFIHGENIITYGADTLREGSQIQFHIVEQKNNRYIASEIEIFRLTHRRPQLVWRSKTH